MIILFYAFEAKRLKTIWNITWMNLKKPKVNNELVLLFKLKNR